MLPVTDDQRRLVGIVDLPDVVTSASSTRVSDLVRPEVLAVRIDDQEHRVVDPEDADQALLGVQHRQRHAIGLLHQPRCCSRPPVLTRWPRADESSPIGRVGSSRQAFRRRLVRGGTVGAVPHPCRAVARRWIVGGSRRVRRGKDLRT